MAYAIIKTGGKQYRVAEGDTLLVEKIEGEAGSTTTFSDVLLVSRGGVITPGLPLVEGASVAAEIIDQVKGDKVIAYKFKRRKGYHRTVGHRQKLTKVKIGGILG